MWEVGEEQSSRGDTVIDATEAVSAFGVGSGYVALTEKSKHPTSTSDQSLGWRRAESTVRKDRMEAQMQSRRPMSILCASQGLSQQVYQILLLARARTTIKQRIDVEKAYPASPVSSPIPAPAPAKACPTIACVKECAVPITAQPMTRQQAPAIAIYRFPKRSCRYPTNGQTDAMARVLATGSQPMILALPRSSAMYVKVPPVK